MMRSPDLQRDYRADIDGLRAVAVLFVIAFHVRSSYLPGGFTGVDVFFVISGFLITKIILIDLKSNSFSFLNFYGRRIRRLFPALAVVLASVWLAGWFILFPQDYAALSKHIVAGAGFYSNFQTYSEGGYFDIPAAQKPLLHLWSLGVEEQFYFVFPFVLFVCSRCKPKLAIPCVLILLAISSFVLNLRLVQSDQSLAFYFPVTRFWEFMIGSSIAYIEVNNPFGRLKAPSFMRWDKQLRECAACTGALLLLVSAFLIKEKLFPGWWAFLPTVGAALIIGAGQRTWVNRAFLANPILVFIGIISYPLYLWHWPLLVLGRSLNEGNIPGIVLLPILVALSFILAWLTHRYIETPVRELAAARGLGRISLIGTVAMLSLALIAILTLNGEGFPRRYRPEVAALLKPISPEVDVSRVAEANEIGGPWFVIWGDSHAAHLYPGLSEMQKKRTFRIMPLSWDRCPPVDEIVPDEQIRCEQVRIRSDDILRDLNPDTVIVSAFWQQYSNVEKIGETLTYLKAIGVRRVILVGPVPRWPTQLPMLLYKTYKTEGIVPYRLSNFDHVAYDIDRRLKEISVMHRVDYVSLLDILCDEQGCLTRLGDTTADIIQVDYTHFSPRGSQFVIDHASSTIFDD